MTPATAISIITRGAAHGTTSLSLAEQCQWTEAVRAAGDGFSDEYFAAYIKINRHERARVEAPVRQGWLP